MTLKWNKMLIAAVQAELRKEVLTQTIAVETEAKRLILNTAKTGRIYRRNGTSHQSSSGDNSPNIALSSPELGQITGEPYASDTGQTISKIRVTTSENGLRGQVVFGGENAMRLEFGTPNGRMQQRPFARPAFAIRQPKITTGLAEAVKRGLRVA